MGGTSWAAARWRVYPPHCWAGTEEWHKTAGRIGRMWPDPGMGNAWLDQDKGLSRNQHTVKCGAEKLVYVRGKLLILITHSQRGFTGSNLCSGLGLAQGSSSGHVTEQSLLPRWKQQNSIHRHWMVKDIEVLTQGLGTILWVMMIQNFEQESDRVRKGQIQMEVNSD